MADGGVFLPQVAAADLFCGAGGTSLGARLALNALGRRMSLVAVNHWQLAVDTHAGNSPAHFSHHCVDLYHAHPRDLVPDGWLDLLLASPTCTFHSRARGGRPTSDQQRMDPWRVVEWLTELRVERLLLENVPELADWGPVDEDTGRPVPDGRGRYFEAFVAALRGLGYQVDHRILCCADYGDATTRRRLFLQARRDRAIRWPAPSHARPDLAPGLGLAPWRPAREIIDWSLPGTSIFTRPRPLAPATLRRIAAGLVKFGGAAAEPFLVVLRHHADARSLDLPLPTVATAGAIGLIEPLIAPYYGSGSGESCASSGQPLPTVTTKARFGLVEPVIGPFTVSPRHGKEGGGPRPRPATDPLPTITAGGSQAALVEPFLARFAHSDRGDGVRRPLDLDDPLPTLTTHGDLGLAVPILEPPSGPDDIRLVRTTDGPVLVDILFRMLKPHELAAAMGFPDDYRFNGTQEQQIRQIGNAVPVNTARALVTALFDVDQP